MGYCPVFGPGSWSLHHIVSSCSWHCSTPSVPYTHRRCCCVLRMPHSLLAEWCSTEGGQINVRFSIGEETFNRLGVYNMANVIIENAHEILLSMRRGVVKTRNLCSCEAQLFSATWYILLVCHGVCF